MKKKFIAEYFSNSATDTFSLGYEIGKNLQKDSIIGFLGDLGAGKTTLIKGISNFFKIEKDDVNSPTFSYLNIYNGTVSNGDIFIYHFDLYRVLDKNHFISLGFDEYFSKKGLNLLEWSENIFDLIPQNTLIINLEHLDENKRKVTLFRKQ